jgi:hypothetical protein
MPVINVAGRHEFYCSTVSGLFRDLKAVMESKQQHRRAGERNNPKRGQYFSWLHGLERFSTVAGCQGRPSRRRRGTEAHV